MSQITLKWLRFAAPGVIILACAALLGYLTALWSMPWADVTKRTLQSLTVLVPAGLYYLTPFRGWANHRYFKKVSENLRAAMVRLSGLADDRSVYAWASLRGVFYHIVDNDKSLTTKASLAYFNGFVWTTIADLRAISLLFTLAAAGLSWVDVPGAIGASAIFAITFLLTFPASARATRMHMEIGNQQMEIIALYHRDEVQKQLENIRDHAARAGN